MKIIATDLDGTIYLQSKIIPGVEDSIHEAKNKNFKFIFITNNSSETPYQIKNKLENMLSNEINLNDIVSPLVILKDYLKNINKKIYVHGSYNLQKYVKTITTELFPIHKSEIILIGRTDSFSRHDVESIADAFNRGVDVIAMNKDLTFPINDLSRGLGDVYKRQYVHGSNNLQKYVKTITTELFPIHKSEIILIGLSLIHI